MGQMIDFKRPDGQSAPAYLAEPEAGSSAPSVVVIQEWWGLNEQIKKVADRVAAAGFRALTPDLYRGRLAADADEANHMMTGLDWGEATVQDIRGALQHLKQNGKPAAVMGFCMGGALTILSLAKVEEADAGVCFYGIPPAEAADPSQIKVPLLAHFATQDDWCTPQVVDQLEAKLKSGGVDHELHRYEAHHAFMNEARPEVYHPEHAKQAWDRTLAFLGRTLK